MITENKSFCASYIFEEEDTFYKLGYQIVNNKKTVNTLKCLKVMHNDSIKIMYSVENLVLIDELFRTDSVSYIASIIKEIISIINKNVEDGFFVKEAFDISYDRIFYDKENKQICMILLPINKEYDLHDNKTWQDRFRKTMLQILRYNKGNTKLNELYNLIYFEKISYDKIKAKIFNETVRYEDKYQKTSSLSSRFLPSIGHYYLISDAGERYDINKDDMIFGSSKKLADVVVANSKHISRMHFRIKKKDNSYYLSDLDSTNHTYYNEKMLTSGQEVVISDGSVIKAAEVIFHVRCD